MRLVGHRQTSSQQEGTKDVCEVMQSGMVGIRVAPARGRVYFRKVLACSPAASDDSFPNPGRTRLGWTQVGPKRKCTRAIPLLNRTLINHSRGVDTFAAPQWIGRRLLTCCVALFSSPELSSRLPGLPGHRNSLMPSIAAALSAVMRHPGPRSVMLRGKPRNTV